MESLKTIVTSVAASKYLYYIYLLGAGDGERPRLAITMDFVIEIKN